MPEEVNIKLPSKLVKFIDSLTEQGYFSSREDFIRCSIEIIAELYGRSRTASGGKSLLDILIDNGRGIKTGSISPKHTSNITLSKEEHDVLDLFIGVKFEYEDALHARYTMEALKSGKSPVPLETFQKILKSLASKEKITKTKQNEKIIWKLISIE